MASWEYRQTVLLSEDEMRRLGKDGWELVSVVQQVHGSASSIGVYAGHLLMFWRRERGS